MRVQKDTRRIIVNLYTRIVFKLYFRLLRVRKSKADAQCYLTEPERLRPCADRPFAGTTF